MVGCSSRDGAVVRVQVEETEMRMVQAGPCICYQAGGPEQSLAVDYETHTHWEWYT